MRSKSAQISIAIVCLVLGIMLAVQFKTNRSVNETLTPERVKELTQELNKVIEDRDTLAQEVDSLREKLQNFRETDQAMADLQDELSKANMAAGTSAVHGPGIIITLNDSPRTLQAGEDPNYGIIHDQDLVLVVNELRASGAEAIAINGERLTSMSEIRCAGTLILVNWAKIGPPFVLQAIGDPEMLESGMNIRGGHLDTLKYLGLQVSVQKVEDIELPAYSRPMKFTFAQPPQPKEKAET